MDVGVRENELTDFAVQGEPMRPSAEREHKHARGGEEAVARGDKRCACLQRVREALRRFARRFPHGTRARVVQRTVVHPLVRDVAVLQVLNQLLVDRKDGACQVAYRVSKRRAACGVRRGDGASWRREK